MRPPRITVDLRDNPPAYPCGLNLSQACALSACMVGVFNTVGHRVPPNAGSYRRIEVILGEGTVCGIPRHPTSTSVATTNLGDRVTCAVQRALAQIGDGIGMADGGAAIPATGAVLSGADPRHDGEPFCNEVILLGGSAPARLTPTAGSRCSPWATRACRSWTASRSTRSTIRSWSTSAASCRTAKAPAATGADRGSGSSTARSIAISSSATSATAASIPPGARAAAGAPAPRATSGARCRASSSRCGR